MTREWKPGDVATFDAGDGERVTIIRTSEGKWTGYAPGRDRSWIDRTWFDGQHDLRPVVVIDPEDHEQVSAFAATVKRCKGAPHSCINTGCFADRLQAAFRSLVEPPKHEEPTGLGAVVYGWAYSDKVRPFVRCASDNAPWMDEGGNGHNWSEIYPERVESEGVVAR